MYIVAFTLLDPKKINHKMEIYMGFKGWVANSYFIYMWFSALVTKLDAFLVSNMHNLDQIHPRLKALVADCSFLSNRFREKR